MYSSSDSHSQIVTMTFTFEFKLTAMTYTVVRGGVILLFSNSRYCHQFLGRFWFQEERFDRVRIG